MEKLSKVELVKYLVENYTNGNGVVDLSGLDFSGYKKDINISFMKVDRYLFQENQDVKGNLYQNCQKVGSNLEQSYQQVKGDLFQGGQDVKGDLDQSCQIVGKDLNQNHQLVKGDLC